METNAHNQTPAPKNPSQDSPTPAIEHIENKVNTVSQEFQRFLEDIESLVKSIAQLTGNELEAAKTQLKDRIATAKLTIAEVRSNLAKQACDTISATDTYVHEQPWKAVGTSAAIGFLLGLILARRNH